MWRRGGEKRSLEEDETLLLFEKKGENKQLLSKKSRVWLGLILIVALFIFGAFTRNMISLNQTNVDLTRVLFKHDNTTDYNYTSSNFTELSQPSLNSNPEPTPTEPTPASNQEPLQTTLRDNTTHKTPGNNHQESYTDPELTCTVEEYQRLCKHYPEQMEALRVGSWRFRLSMFRAHQHDLFIDNPELHFILKDHSTPYFASSLFKNSSQHHYQKQERSSRFTYKSFDDHQPLNTSSSTVFTYDPYLIEIPGFATVQDRYIWLCLASTGMARIDPPYQFISSTNNFLKSIDKNSTSNLPPIHAQSEVLSKIFPFPRIDQWNTRRVPDPSSENSTITLATGVQTLMITPTSGKFLYIHKPEHLTGTFTTLKNVYWNPDNQDLSHLWDAEYSCFYTPKNIHNHTTYNTLLQNKLNTTVLNTTDSVQVVELGLYTLTPDSFMWQHHFDSLVVLSQSFKDFIQPLVHNKNSTSLRLLLAQPDIQFHIRNLFPDSFSFLTQDSNSISVTNITLSDTQPYFFHSLLYPCGIPSLYHPYLIQNIASTFLPPVQSSDPITFIQKTTRIYFFSRRKALRRRNFLNERDVLDGIRWWISDQNRKRWYEKFELIEVEDQVANSFEESLAKFSDELLDPPVLIGAHGGALYNAMFCRRGLLMIEIAPVRIAESREEERKGEGWMTWLFLQWVRGMGGKYYMVWGESERSGDAMWNIMPTINVEKILWILQEELGV